MVESKRVWRFIDYNEHDGATNMAIDEAILEAYLQGLAPPTLRVYGFAPPAVSIGYNQKIPNDLLTKAPGHGFSVVRRPTGGRAVLHIGDFTYSFVCGSSDNIKQERDNDRILSSSVSVAYKQICCGLQIAFEKLGLKLELGDSRESYRAQHDCFGATTGSDLHYQGNKIIGSAQLRRKHAVLQHGSILLNQDQDLMPVLLGQPISGQRHANLFEIIGSISIDRLQDVIRSGFEEAFSVQLITSKLSKAEIELSSCLDSKHLSGVY